MHNGPRDKNGKFLNYKKPPIDASKIREAYIDGLNAQGGLEKRPSVLADRYLKQKGYV